MTLAFDTITLTRDIGCAPSRLFGLLTDRAARAAWGAPDAESVIEIDHFDMRPGGHEVARCGPKEDPHFGTRTDFHAVEDGRFVVGSESLTVGGEMLSVALVSCEVGARDTGSRLTVTLQIASLSGPEVLEDYRGGWSGALENLARLAEAEAVA